MSALDDLLNPKNEYTVGIPHLDEAAAELATLKDKTVCGCGTPLGYHEEENEMEWCHNEPVTGICKEHWDQFMRQREEDKTIATLRADLENVHEVVGKALEWLVDFTESHEDDSAHELYLDLRKWYEGESAVQNSSKNTHI